MLDSEIILLGYPKSGNNWVRYILEYLYHTPTSGHYSDIKTIIKSTRTLNSPLYLSLDNIKINENHKMIWHTHIGELSLPFFKNKNLPVILVLRDFKECIYRLNDDINVQKNLNDYYSMLPYVDNKNSVTLYYENLIDNSLIINELNKLSNFLKQKVCYDEFMNNIVEHRETMLEVYQNTNSKYFHYGELVRHKSHTKGMKKVFHSKKHNKNEEMVRILKGRPLTEKYLKNYL